MKWKALNLNWKSERYIWHFAWGYPKPPALNFKNWTNTASLFCVPTEVMLQKHLHAHCLGWMLVWKESFQKWQTEMIDKQAETPPCSDWLDIEGAHHFLSKLYGLGLQIAARMWDKPVLIWQNIYWLHLWMSVHTSKCFSRSNYRWSKIYCASKSQVLTPCSVV